MEVKVTQFQRPNGRTNTVSTEVPNDCAVGYEAMQRKGCRLTAEVLPNSLVSLCIEHPEGDYYIQLARNGPKVQATIAEALRNFDEVAFDEWLKAVTE